jgi:N-acetylneuraminate synthase
MRHNPSAEFTIGRHPVGANRPTYFIADIAANHDGDLERAKALIHLCAEAGGNAAKFQNFRAETIVSDYGFKSIGGRQSHQAKWKRSVYQVYDEAALPIDWTETLKATCDDAGIDYLTAPYDPSLLPALSQHVAAWKVGSGDITWLDNIEAMAADGKPLLLATGAAAMADVRRAVGAVLRHTGEIALLQCNTNYTGSPENFHHIALNVLRAYAREWPGMVLGLSDHTPGHATVLGAVALGARVVEKHFTDDTARTGPDHGFAMDPRAWAEMLARTRELEAALGTEEKRIMPNEADTVVLQRRAVRALGAIAKDEIVSADKLTVLRPCPADALPPYRIDEVVGRLAARDIEAGDCVRPADVT